MSDYSSDPRPRDPVDPRGAFTPPPPPPPASAGYAYGYPPPPAAEKKGILGGITKIGGLISLAFLLFIVGFYVGLIVISQDPIRPSTYREGEGTDKIAIIPVDGVIGSGTASFIHSVVDKVIADPTVKAVVLRVDSPGGGVTPSDEIYQSILRLKRERNIPVVASYGSMAASGGYYVSCNADYIFVQPTTVTGSIGVLGQAFTMQKLAEKIGVDPLLITSTRSTEKDLANNTFRNWTPADVEVMKKMLDVMYDQFVEVVYAGRKGKFDTREAVMQVATGRIYTAQASIDAKLTDEIGYMDAAIEKARSLGSIAAAKPPVVIYRSPAGFGDLFGITARPAAAASGSGSGAGWSIDLNIDAASVRQALTELSVPQPAYLMQP